MTFDLRRFQFEPCDFFVIRTPLLPVDALIAWGDGLEAGGATDDDALDAALTRDHARLTERLRAIVARPEMREAIFLASPELSERILAWERGALRDGDELRLTRTLVRYFTRMASRPTPFGLFAGIGVGRIGDETRLTLGTRTPRRHVYLDMGYVEALMVGLQSKPGVREKLRYQANSSISQSAGRLHYIETHHRGAGRVYTLAAVDASPEVCAVLRRAHVPTTLAELAAALISDEVDADEATSFVGEMIDAQLLVSDLEPALTGTRSLEDLCTTLAPLDEHVARVISQVAAAVRDVEAAPLGIAPDAYARIRAQLDELSVPSDATHGVFQVDLGLDADVALGTEVVEEFARAADCLFRIGFPESRPLEGFVKAFVERYDLREVPLLEALDEELGIGLPAEPTDPNKDGARMGQQLAVMRLLADAFANGSNEIVLTDADLDAISYRGARADLPPGYSMMGALSAESETALRNGEFQLVLDGATGPSGATLFGRFCHNDPALASLVARQLAAEEASDPDALHAELVHLSEGRMGNVLARPVLRRYEIPFLGRSGAAPDQQLRLDDLLVSVRDGRIILRSRRLQREVIPHLTTAHNADLPDSPRVYRFLAHFQRQRRRYALTWPWSSLAELPYLPRVTYGRTVLSRARWMVDARDIAPLVQARGAARVHAVRAWRERARLPRYVQLKDGDNALFVDFDNPLCVDVLLELVKRRPGMMLAEMLPAPGDSAVASAEGRFLHEIIVPFVRRQPEEAPEPTREQTSTRVAQTPAIRRFAPGSEWLYAKLYCGVGVSDRVLREAVAPLVQHAIGSGAAERWFYLRYSDPQPHLRLRFFGDPGRLAAHVLPALTAATAPFLRDGRIWRVQLDTYEREVERYGGSLGVELSERLFSADSTAALTLVDEYGGNARVEPRAMLTMVGIDRLLADFGLDTAERVALLASVESDSADFHRQQGDAYRRMRGAIEPVLAGASDPELDAGLAALDRRSVEIAPIADALRAGLASGAVEGVLRPLLLSFTHMFVNRVEAIEPNRAERQYYDFIRRFHAGQLARGKQRAASPRSRAEVATALTY